MDKEFIPYEQALALKELGFDEECFKGYTETYKTLISFSSNPTNTSIENALPTKPFTAPLYQQAFRWFRDKHFIDISIQRLPIIDKGWLYYSSIDYHPKYKDIDDYDDNDGEYYKTYEEAELECLKKLIEIAKSR